MGVPAALIGGALLGMFLGNRNQSNSSANYSSGYSSGPTSYMETPAGALPAAPEAPLTEDGSKSESIIAAEEEEKAKRAAESEANQTKYTGGLGLSSTPTIGKNTLLG